MAHPSLQGCSITREDVLDLGIACKWLACHSGSRPADGGQSLIGGDQAEIASSGVLKISYAYVPTHAKGKFTEAELSIVVPRQLTECRWISQGPSAGYPGKDRPNEFGIFHLNAEDISFQSNHRETFSPP